MRRILPVLALVTATAACGTTASQSVRPAPASHRLVNAAAASPARSVAVAATPAGPKVGVRHIFMIVLENESFASTYVTNPNPYLRHTLEKQGTLLTQYYATGHHSLDNYLSMISGQAPNTTSSADCTGYTAIPGNAPLNSHGQETAGGGCVYPKNVPTIGSQLSAKKLSWHGWMEDMGKMVGREQATCGVPTVVAGVDDTQAALPIDQYAARHNPFAYFKSLINTGLCKKHVTPLTGLPAALKTVSTTPRFNFITPNLCDDGHDANCAGTNSKGGTTGGLVGIDAFLSTWVPKIEASPAFKKDGLLIITSDESDSGDKSSCCGEKPGPVDPGGPGDPGAGGGRIGTLLIGHCIAANHTDAVKYNHYSLLRSLENLYGITTGGTDHHGHIGYAAVSTLRPFGADVFSKCKSLA